MIPIPLTNEDALQRELDALRTENAELRRQLRLKPTPSAAERIRLAVAAKVEELTAVAKGTTPGYRLRARQLKSACTADLKWALRIRYAKEFADADVEPALEFIADWIPPKHLQ